MKDDALEKLAEAEHVQWCEWADALSRELSSLLEIIERHECDLSDEEHLLFLKVKGRLDRWDRLMVPYSDLPEDEKEKDRVYARKILDTVND
ncbi:hypothetical protein [Methanobrevibacter sp. UBA212]|uniref:hypothetical protein n=1 Tax=Methanobrevibacter sp. UBA212 TaxID=1915476 RepID=UPI0025D6C42E|nr:hypothetical protein [Methanobrevibacter sp. UBA212]